MSIAAGQLLAAPIIFLIAFITPAPRATWRACASRSSARATFVACSLDLPLQVLLLDTTKTNFSAWRGAIEQARLRFTQLQALMIERFHKPVYLWKVL